MRNGTRTALLSSALLVSSTLLPGTSVLLAGDGGWVQDFEQAKATAAAEGKDLLMDFTGSDWCGWCIRLDKEVFDTEVFQAAIHEQFVLVKLDYPRDQSLVTDEIRAQNEGLQEEYGIEGFPTIFLADAQGRPFGRTGYQQGGPESYLEHLKEFRDARVKRDELFAKAEQASGTEKAALIDQALAALDSSLLLPYYCEEVESIIALDSADEGGLKSKYDKVVTNHELKSVRQDLMEQFSMLAQAGKWDEAASEMEAAIEKHKDAGSVVHAASFFLGICDAQQGNFDSALEWLGKARDADGEGDFSRQIPMVEKDIRAKMAEAEKEQGPDGDGDQGSGS